ncbi:MAG: DNA topoisomerase I [Candidatus Thorarchaeota archaeon]|nr:DNA topoisomerase I [Candidatus Thorarchaeota archaeon]
MKIMVIAEKPMAAKRIATVLDSNEEPEEVKHGGSSYFRCRRNNDTIHVVYALGHLYELQQTEKGWTYPRLDTRWVPKHEVDKKAVETRRAISTIKHVAKTAEQYVVATDLDTEGSLIGYLVVKYACEKEPYEAKRMCFSTLTKADIERAYENPLPTLDFPLIDAGHVRHEIDWLYGVNLTRALTLVVKRLTGWFKIVSTGRVQGPALALVARRNQGISLFVPTPYWTIKIVGELDGQEVEPEYTHGRIRSLVEADELVSSLRGKEALVENIASRHITQSPPEPFNLSVLQSEAFRCFGFRPSRTLDISQKLYLDALISYPRTNSQQIPEGIDVRGILAGLRRQRTYASTVDALIAADRIIPRQGKQTDPAHPAIHPTGEAPSRKLSTQEQRVYDLIVKRFLASLGPSAEKEALRADISAEGHQLRLRGMTTVEAGWTATYQPYVSVEDRPMPSVTVGDKITLVSVEAKRCLTKPPPHYNPSSLVKALEKEGLGTKGTRAKIVDSLKTRGYTLNDQFEMSSLGYAVYETLEREIPRIVSAEFTRRLEERMECIQEGHARREDVLREAREELLEVLNVFSSKEEAIGRGLVVGLKRYWTERDEIGWCPKCKEGRLGIVTSPKTRKRFLGCSRYKDGCDQTFPLPQKGTVMPLNRTCEFCGHQMIRVVSGRGVWDTCINWAQCPGRQEDLKVLEERRKKRSMPKE